MNLVGFIVRILCQFNEISNRMKINCDEYYNTQPTAIYVFVLREIFGCERHVVVLRGVFGCERHVVVLRDINFNS